MKKLIFTIVILACSFNSAEAQWWTGNEKVKGNGDMTNQERRVSDYDQVALEGSMDVELVAGREGHLKIEAESNLMEYILTEVSGGKLKIYIKKGYNVQPSWNKSIKITVPFENLDQVSLTGSGDIYNSDKINAGEFRVQVTGSGDINLDLEAASVSGTITGSGDIVLRGSTRSFECKVTGSGDFQAYDLKAEHVSASVSGSGDIEVSPLQELRARITGSGDITYMGNPEKQDFRTAGSGAVSRR